MGFSHIVLAFCFIFFCKRKLSNGKNMFDCLTGLLMVGLVLFTQSNALAQTLTQTVDIEGFGADNGGADMAIGDLDLIAEITFMLPAITSFDSISLELAHTFGSDVQIELVDPTSATTVIIVGQGEVDPVGAPHDDGSDLGDTMGNPGLLANVVNYELVATASPLFMDHSGGDVLAAGIYGADAWVTGVFAAGNWTVRILDAWDTGDTGSIGDVSVSFTPVPEPGTIALAVLAMGSVLGLRRRRS